MTTTPPAPFPENGQRTLSPKEVMQRAKALVCTMPKDKMPTCSEQVFVGIFFDGTFNNRDNDKRRQKGTDHDYLRVVMIKS